MPQPDRKPPATRHKMTYPSGGIVVLDAGTLLAATPIELAALQRCLREAAEETTRDGRPFRTQRDETLVGDVLVAPVAAPEAPHAVNVIRENGRAARVVIELDGPGTVGTLAVPEVPLPADPAHATPPQTAPVKPVVDVPPPAPTEHFPSPPGMFDGAPRPATVARPATVEASGPALLQPLRKGAIIALLAGLGLLVACGGETSSSTTPRDETAQQADTTQQADATAGNRMSDALLPHVVPELWFELAERAEDDTLPISARVAAVSRLADAGPHAHLVRPLLHDLASDASVSASVRSEALQVLQHLQQEAQSDAGPTWISKR